MILTIGRLEEVEAFTYFYHERLEVISFVIRSQFWLESLLVIAEGTDHLLHAMLMGLITGGQLIAQLGSTHAFLNGYIAT